MGKLTKKAVEAAEPGEAEYFLWDEGDGSTKGFGLRVFPSGRKVFLAQFRVGGGRGAKSRRVTLGSFGPWTVERARAEADRLISAANVGVDLKGNEEARQAAAEAAERETAEEAARREALRFRSLSERYLTEHVALKRKPGTLSFYRTVLTKHVWPVIGDHDAREITRQDIAKLHGDLADRAVTGNRSVSIVAAVFAWAIKLEILPETMRNPAARVEMYREHGRERFLSTEELERLGAAIREAESVGVAWDPSPEGKSKHAPKPENRLVKIAPEAAAALRMLIFSGCRLREILHLEWAAVDLERGLLRLRDSKTGPKVVVLNAPARAVLVALPRRGKYVFPGEPATGPDGKLIERPKADLKRPWSMVTRRAGLSGLRIHDLRHSFASVGAGDGHGLAIVGKLLGHTQSRTTEKYAHLADDPLRQASDQIAKRIAVAMGEAPAPDPDEPGKIVSLPQRRAK